MFVVVVYSRHPTKISEGEFLWLRAQTALSRGGDNIEEGHHMERCWGLLLATPLQHFQMEALWNYSNSSYYEMYTNQTEPGLLFRSTPQ